MDDAEFVAIALGGYELANPDDPIWIVPPGVLDQQILTRGLDQQRREDVQIWSFLVAVAVGSQSMHPITVEPGPDLNRPPDRIIASRAGRWMCELTELTLEVVRRDLAPIRAFGRSLRSTLESDTRFEHLRGRQLVVTTVSNQPSDFIGDALGPLLEALTEDKGCAGDEVDLSAGFPTEWPNDRGFYGQIGPFVVNVNAGGVEGTFTVISSTGSRIRRSEAVAAIQASLDDKDIAGNDLVLMTCGLPDDKGYVCPIDDWLFELLRAEAEAGRSLISRPPSHVRAVALHHWRLGQWLTVFGEPGSAPWLPA